MEMRSEELHIVLIGDLRNIGGLFLSFCKLEESFYAVSNGRKIQRLFLVAFFSQKHFSPRRLFPGENCYKEQNIFLLIERQHFHAVCRNQVSV